jgi:phosphate transporter
MLAQSNMDGSEIRRVRPAGPSAGAPSPLPLLCLLVFAVLYLCPIFEAHPAAHSCCAILGAAAMLWGTECIPSYATAYAVLALSVWLSVGVDPGTGGRISAKALATTLCEKFMDPIILVFLGSLTISAGLAKLEITDRVSLYVLRRIPQRPVVVLLALMVLNYLLASILSNIASTTLTLAFADRIIRSLEPDDPFIRVALLGLAWSGNCGGMATPIASPQNVLAMKYINLDRQVVSFGQWLAFALPSSLLILLVFWAYLAVLLQRARKSALLPEVEQVEPATRWGVKHTLTLFVTIATIVLWALNSVAEDVLGHEGITSVIPVVVLFSTGVLDSRDFGALRWSTLALMGGGLALGEAMRLSGLLDLLANTISAGLGGIPTWWVLVITLLFEAAVTSVISHTSGAAILFPVLGMVGQKRGEKTTFLAASALMISASQLFHISSFPNALVSGVQMHSRANPRALNLQSFLSGKDFIMLGWPTVVAAVAIVASVTYGIVQAMDLA